MFAAQYLFTKKNLLNEKIRNARETNTNAVMNKISQPVETEIIS